MPVIPEMSEGSQRKILGVLYSLKGLGIGDIRRLPHYACINGELIYAQSRNPYGGIAPSLSDLVFLQETYNLTTKHIHEMQTYNDTMIAYDHRYATETITYSPLERLFAMIFIIEHWNEVIAS